MGKTLPMIPTQYTLRIYYSQSQIPIPTSFDAVSKEFASLLADLYLGVLRLGTVTLILSAPGTCSFIEISNSKR